MHLYACGLNDNGELGLGGKSSAGSVLRPRHLKELAERTAYGGIINMAVGGMHCAALTANNKILTWGVNDNFALGRDTTWTEGLRDAGSDADSTDGDLNPLEATPTPIDEHHFPPNTSFVHVAASDSATFAVTEKGVVFGWGTFRGADGIIGFSPSTRIQKTPIQISGLKRVTKLACGSNHVLALDLSGRVFSWGCGEQGRLARRILARHAHKSLIPQSVGLKNIQDIGTGSEHSFAVDAKGKVWSWGANGFGQTGVQDKNGNREESVLRPTIISSFDGTAGKVTLITGGNHHSLALTEAGSCLTWGRADSMACGLRVPPAPTNIVRDEGGRARIISAPTIVPGLTDIVAAGAGSDHCLAVRKDGHVFGWGFNTMGQVGVGTEDDVEEPALLNGKAIRDQKVIWAGCGGQFSVLGVVPSFPTSPVAPAPAVPN
ncbi:RCC1/BLIP-II protein [Xylona heveae TC161]|uniref:RCC1/BLIP-II protein n=1 Tax=Xylona heveae (strain CBS 132557 / TC161) TaxID=1328760 RepID=A0A165AD82_XYLHT|nr:RCC1/BLIP-II protein [Xylona heveae TC161]KZF20285.1 RCC1/BLIP-II protein [Xylona heveae TC161]